MSAAGLMPWSAWVASDASRMPDSKRFRKYPEPDASTTRCALNSTPSAQTEKSVSRSSCQRATSEEWCRTPSLSVSLGAAPAGGEEDEASVATAVRARFFDTIDRLARGIRSVHLTRISRQCRSGAQLHTPHTQKLALARESERVSPETDIHERVAAQRCGSPRLEQGVRLHHT